MRTILNALAPVFALLGATIIFLVFLKKDSRDYDKKKASFLTTERQASFSRVNPIEDSRYIKPVIEKFPLAEKEDVKTEKEIYAYEIQKVVVEKAKKTMAHFDESNLDLKIMYGVATLETIIQYEENYGEFLHKLHLWAKALVDADKKNDATQVLEEGIKLGLDFTQSFILLADLYKESNNQQALKNLYELTIQNKNITMSKTNKYIQDLIEK